MTEEFSTRESCQTAIEDKTRLLKSIVTRMTQDRVGRGYQERMTEAANLQSEITALQLKLLSL
jgi:hypothetical protein